MLRAQTGQKRFSLLCFTDWKCRGQKAYRNTEMWHWGRHLWDIIWPRMENSFDSTRSKFQAGGGNWQGLQIPCSFAIAKRKNSLRVRNFSEADSWGLKGAIERPSRTTAKSLEGTTNRPKTRKVASQGCPINVNADSRNCCHIHFNCRWG